MMLFIRTSYCNKIQYLLEINYRSEMKIENYISNLIILIFNRICRLKKIQIGKELYCFHLHACSSSAREC